MHIERSQIAHNLLKMLNRALIFSTITILFLLALQAVWLFRIIDNEKSEYKKQTETILQESIKEELNYRFSSFNKKNNFRVVLSNSYENDKNNSSGVQEIQEISVKGELQGVTKVSFEEVLQEVYKNDAPINLDTLASFFSKSLEKVQKATNFILTYSSPDTVKRIQYSNEKAGINFLSPTFETIVPLTASKELTITAEIFYPRSLFQGDLLIILMLSLVVTIFILFSIVMQTRMLFKQVSLAKVKENITHFLTHELRSPLQSSITNLEVGEMAQGENSAYFLQKAKEQLYFLNGLIENILDINKFEKRQAALNKTQFNIDEAIEPHIARHKVSPKKSVTITAAVSPECELIYADKLHITNAIGNLIDNAIKYSNDPVEIKIAASCNSKYFIITVQDNGIGIPKDEQSKVFEKFYRVSKREHSQKGKGFGLGLTYVTWVVKAHKGKIYLESEVGKGSIFTLSIKNEEHGTEDITGR